MAPSVIYLYLDVELHWEGWTIVGYFVIFFYDDLLLRYTILRPRPFRLIRPNVKKNNIFIRNKDDIGMDVLKVDISLGRNL
jgi:hypothetical protein